MDLNGASSKSNGSEQSVFHPGSNKLCLSYTETNSAYIFKGQPYTQAFVNLNNVVI
jgi:hypothetical protein